jgi:AcrR family transcriptional regulator
MQAFLPSDLPADLPADGSLRRRPVQRRSQERVARILDACSDLLDEAGHEGLTTKAVARRAGVPIGTLYQFFPNLQGLLGALARRNLEGYLDRLTRRTEDERPARIGDLVDLAVDEYVTMRRTLPGFGVVDFGLIGHQDPSSSHLLDSALDNNSAVAERLRAFGDTLLPGSWPDRSTVITALRVALEAADAVLRLAFRTDPDGDPVLIAECKRLLRAYLGGGPS